MFCRTAAEYDAGSTASEVSALERDSEEKQDSVVGDDADRNSGEDARIRSTNGAVKA